MHRDSILLPRFRVHRLLPFPLRLGTMAQVFQLSMVVFALMAIWAMPDMNSPFAAVQGSQGVRLMYGVGNGNRTSLEEHANKNDGQFYPIRQTRYWAFKVDERRKLAPFQLCSGCTCCSGTGNQSVCTTSACCYSITCGLPDKPYGVCAFTPKACNCTSCGS